MSATNQSLPDSSATPPCSSDSEFSLENVVGMFLTLSLCLLTQPYGSLFYSPPHDDESTTLKQSAFAFWRLNPLACLSEAVIVCFLLTQALGSAVKGGVLPELSRRFPFYSPGSVRNRRWREHWHVHAAALLLLRANSHDGGPHYHQNLLGRLLSPSFWDHSAQETGPHNNASPRESNTYFHQVSEQVEIEASTVFPTLSDPASGVLRRRTSRLGSGLPTAGNLSHEKLLQLRKALGTNVLAHREKWVDLVTTFSVLVIMVKLAATTLPWDIRVASVFFLTGWSSIQLLLYLFHLQELEDEAAVPIITTARTHKPDLDNKWVSVMLSVVVALPLVYLGYCAAGIKDMVIYFTRFELSVGAWLLHGPVLCIYAFAFLTASTVICSFPIPLMAMVVVGTVNALDSLGASKRVEIAGMMIACCATGSFYLAILKKIYDTERGIKWMIATIDFLTSIVASVGVVGLLWTCLFSPKRSESTRSGHQIVVLFNTVLALYIFAQLLSAYDPTGTYKPAFLDYLG